MAMEASGEVGWGSFPARPEAVFDSKDVVNYLSEVTDDLMAAMGSSRRGIDWAATFFRRGKARTIAASSVKARDADREQCSFADGPVLEALTTAEFVLVSDLRRDRRWPGYSSAAADHGVQSLLSMPIVSTGGTSAAINLYASSAHAFTSEDVVRTMRYAREVGRALHVVVRVAERAEATAELAVAQSSLALVDLALRSLMRESGLTPDDALQYLRTAASPGNSGLDAAAFNAVGPAPMDEGASPDEPPWAEPPGTEPPAAKTSRIERTG